MSMTVIISMPNVNTQIRDWWSVRAKCYVLSFHKNQNHINTQVVIQTFGTICCVGLLSILMLITRGFLSVQL